LVLYECFKKVIRKFQIKLGEYCGTGCGATVPILVSTDVLWDRSWSNGTSSGRIGARALSAAGRLGELEA
jgi:hypothetical protein